MAASDHGEPRSPSADHGPEQDLTSRLGARQNEGKHDELGEEDERGEAHKDAVENYQEHDAMLPSSPPVVPQSKSQHSIADDGDEHESRNLSEDDRERRSVDAAAYSLGNDAHAHSSSDQVDDISPSRNASEPRHSRQDSASQARHNLRSHEASSESVTDPDPEAPLRSYDWDGLFDRFEAEMRMKDNEHNELENQWMDLMRVSAVPASCLKDNDCQEDI